MHTLQRTGSHPGPFLLLLVAWTLTGGAVLRAHDPGLSTLDVTVGGARVDATLSLSAPDADLVAPGPESARASAIAAMAARVIAVEADSQFLDAVVERASLDDGAVHVQLSFTAGHAIASVAVRSGVSSALARGHRQLLTVRHGTTVLTERLLDAKSHDVTVSIARAAPSSGTALDLFGLGVGHILAGFDHLVFLAGLLLASRSIRELVTALTAFTAAHSLTLAAAASGLVHAPPAIVEPLIAASIAWVGIENLRTRAHGHDTRRASVRWLVVFGFGLVHGFGFAEALLDLGRWSSALEVVVTLLSFNAGVEAGQLAVAAALLPVVWFVRARPAWNARLVPVCSLTIVAAGCYWLVDRLT